MADTVLATTGGDMSSATLEAVILGGDIAKLSPTQRVSYMMSVCKSLGLNPLTKPFEFITLNGRLVMYARKDCTEQLRNLRGISITIVSRELTEGVYVVTARATDKAGRTDESIGAVPLEGLKGEARANAMMKAETKAKRRVTLSISGLGILDESEIDSIPNARVPDTSSLKEKLEASVAANDEKKKAQQLVEQAAMNLGGEVVEGEFEQPSEGVEYFLPFASKQGRWERGAPISTLSEGDLQGLLKWKGAKDDLRNACEAELERRAHQ